MKSSTWEEVGGRFAVLPEVWMDDLLKHHADDCTGVLASFLTAIPDKERLLVTTFDETRAGFHTKAISSIVVDEAFTPSPHLPAEATKNNNWLANEYTRYLAAFQGRRIELRGCLIRAERDAIDGLRSRSPQSDESIELAAATVAALLGVGGVRAAAYNGSPRDLAAHLALNLAALRDLDVADKSDYERANDVYDLHYLVLGLLTSGLITAEPRLQKAEGVIRRAYRYITNDNLRRFGHID